MKKVLLISFFIIFSMQVFCSSNQNEIALNNSRVLNNGGVTTAPVGMLLPPNVAAMDEQFSGQGRSIAPLPPTATRDQIDEFIALQREMLEIQRRNCEELARCNALKEQEQALRERELAAKIKHDADMLAAERQRIAEEKARADAAAAARANRIARRDYIMQRVAFLDKVIRRDHYDEMKFVDECHHKGLPWNINYTATARNEKQSLLTELSGLGV